MRIIDEQGRLFGKINIIDFLVIVFLFCLVPMFYFGYKIFTKQVEHEVVVARGFVGVEIDCQLIKLSAEVIKLVSVGDQELDEEGEAVGEIVNLGQITPYRYDFDLGEGKRMDKVDPNLKQMEAGLKIKVRTVGDRIYYQDQPVRINSTLTFKSNKYTIFAYLPKEEKTEKEILTEINIDCRFVGLSPEDIRHISLGDKELDEDREVLGEIVSLGKSRPGQSLKEIDAKLKLLANKVLKENKFYYKDRAIEIGTPLEFKTDHYTVAAVPTAIKEQRKSVDLYVTLKDLSEEQLKLVSVGDKAVDEKGRVVAEIIKLGEIENSTFEFGLGGGNFVMGTDSNKKQIATKMKVQCKIGKDIKGDDRIFFKGKKLRHKMPFDFQTDKYKAKAVLAKAFKVISPLKEKWISLEVKFTGVVPEIANIVQKGNIEKDPSGNVLGRIVQITHNKPSDVLSLKENEFISLSHPFHRDLLLSLNVQCIEKEGVYYFKSYPVKMGNNITFSTDLYSVTGLIVGMQIK